MVFVSFQPCVTHFDVLLTVTALCCVLVLYSFHLILVTLIFEIRVYSSNILFSSGIFYYNNTV